MIEVETLSKRYGEKLAVDGLDFVVQPGIVTGFLGPNGAGKSTTMRMIAGLDEPTAGRVRVNGRDYRAASAPMAELGILLEAKAMHTGRSARNHLLALAYTNGVSRRRVDELIEAQGRRQRVPPQRRPARRAALRRPDGRRGRRGPGSLSDAAAHSPVRPPAARSGPAA
jgi:ABC-2 type transport system ATP-binding protein